MLTVNHDAPVMLITGAAKRIGATIAEQAHHDGYRVIVHYHASQLAAKDLVNRLNHLRADSAKIVQADLGCIEDAAQLTEFTEQIMQAFGRLDVVVHNASRFYPTPMGQITLSDWQELFLTNAKAPLMLTQALLPHLQSANGNIISLLDIHANDKPFVPYSVYNMAKAAHRSMVQSLALELAPSLRVNGIAPGVNILHEDDSDQAIDPALQSSIIDSIPLQRVGAPEDIAECVMYLASASYVTGQIIAIDGGRSLTLAGHH